MFWWRANVALFGLEKPMNILEPNLAGMIKSVRSTNSPNLVQIFAKWRLRMVVEYNGFVTLHPPFSHFLAS